MEDSGRVPVEARPAEARPAEARSAEARPAEARPLQAWPSSAWPVPERERLLRLDQVLRRADRDVSVHPTTRLPGTNHIARDMQRRLDAKEKFAVCYADLDHFKEFNDRYGYAFGDGVIRMLSRILRDIVRGLAPGGFVGHIGGDDFIFNVPLEYLESTCDLIIELFDELIPYQYTEEEDGESEWRLLKVYH